MLICFSVKDYPILYDDIWVDPDMIEGVSSVKRDYDSLWSINMRSGNAIVLSELNSKTRRSFEKLITDINDVVLYNESRPPFRKLDEE